MGAAFSRVQFMVGRVITGIGIGYITSVTPVYQAEIAATAQRGWQVCCQLTTMLVGLMLAYWINYGFYFHAGPVQWRFPLLFQCIFTLYIVAVTLFLPDTPRWLLRHDKNSSRGIAVLARIRGIDVDNVEVQSEAEEILTAIRLEEKVESTWTDLFSSAGVRAHKRFYLAVGIQFMQQMSGINIVTYYAPTLYTSSLGMSEEMALFLGCFTQLWYVLASFLTWYMIDRVGRRKLFISMALGMCGVLVAEAICVASNTTGGAIAAVVFVFLFEACFTWGWMATVWIYPAEILPLRIRAKGAALAAAADFLGNFLVVEITPVGLQNLGWRFYIIWAVLNIANAVIVWCFYPETSGLRLEAIDNIFVESEEHGDYDVPDGKKPMYRRLQWSMVGRAADAVKHAKIGKTIDFEENNAGLRQRVGSEGDGKAGARHIEGTLE